MALGVGAGLLLVACGLWWFNRSTPPRSPAPVAVAKPLPPLEIPAETQEVKTTVGEEKAATVSAPVVGIPAVPGVARPAVPDPAVHPVGLSDHSAPVVVALAPAPAASSAPAHAADEQAATVRMYAAHASLRAPEVADPDSAANKRILSTMVAKALAQPAAPPVSNSSRR